MKSRVIKLADFDGFIIDPARGRVEIPSELMEDRMKALASNLGSEVSVDAVEENCCVICRAADGKKILLFPSLGFAGMEDACKKAVEVTVGEAFTADVKGARMELTVTDIRANRTAAIDDSLAELAAIPGVRTLEELKAHVRAEEESTARDLVEKELVQEYMEYIVNAAEVEIDETEEQEWCEAMAAQQIADAEMMGGLMLFDETGMPLDEEAALTAMTEEMRAQFKSSLIMKAICEADEYVADLSQLKEMMMIPDEMEMDEAMERMMLENAESMYVFDKLQRRIMEVLS